jgi:acetyl-CoA carboxylase, biotin carboxylase subunit
MKKVLVANRGEIAVRILRACQEMGFESVAVYSEGDEGALHTRYADEAVCIGPTQAAKSYLNSDAVLKAALETGADAIHPGYGFLSENAEFAAAVERAGVTFIGPRPETIALTGDKLAARRAAREAGLVVLGGPDEPFSEEVDASMAAELKFPLLVKAVAGGGGRGIRLARNSEELNNMVAAARQEARAAFGDDTVYLEPLVQNARHIEVQIMGDGQGNIICLGERECSIQRRRQKLIEEAPAPGLSIGMRAQLHQAALQLARALELPQPGNDRIPAGPREPVLLYRSEPAHPGGAPGHRDGDRDRPGYGAAAFGSRRGAALQPGSDPDAGLGDRSARPG